MSATSWRETRTGCPCECGAPAVQIEYRGIIGVQTPGHPGETVANELAFDPAGETVPWGKTLRRRYDVVTDEAEDTLLDAAENFASRLVDGSVTRTQYRVSYPSDGRTYQLRMRAVQWDGETFTEMAILEQTVTGAADEVTEIVVDELPLPIAPVGDVSPASRMFLTGSHSTANAFAGGGTSGEIVISKRGFHPFRQGQETPLYYRVQTASGGFAGCPERELPAVEYTGAWSFADDDVTGDPAGVETPGLSAEVLARGGYQIPSDRLDYAPPGLGAVTETATVRTITRQVACDGELIPDTLTLTLSDPYTTAMLTDAGDAMLEAQLFDILPSSDSQEGRLVARKLLTSGESTYTLTSSVFGPAYSDILVFGGVGTSLDLTIKWRKRVYYRAAGTVTETEESQLVTTASVTTDGGVGGSAIPGGIGETITLTAALGTEVVVDRFTTDIDPLIVSGIRLEEVE